MRTFHNSVSSPAATTSTTSWRWPWATFLMTLSLCVTLATTFNVTFEHEEYEWRTSNNSFRLHSARELLKQRKKNYPRRDSTFKNQTGRYAVADFGSGDDKHESILYSVCLTPTGPRCVLHVHTWMWASRRHAEYLELHVVGLCHTCGPGPGRQQDMAATNTLEYVVHNDENATKRWVHHRVEIGAVHSLFLLALYGYVPNNDSVMAVDDIYLENCALDPDDLRCGADEFSCPHTSQCIPRHKVCDLQDDCLCGEDESDDTCVQIPERGKVTFNGCDFHAGRCFWYNVPSKNKRMLPWKHTSPTNPDDSFLRDQGESFVYVSPHGAQSQWESLLLRSVDFPSLPHGDALCWLNFQYWPSGDPKLTVQLLELGGRDVRTVWTSRDQVPGMWQQASIVLNNQPIVNRYVLQIVVLVESSSKKSGVALTNITLTPTCFSHEAVQLTTCGAKGPEGPTSQMCDVAYQASRDVTVATEPPFQGAQVWAVPASAKYTLQAYGAAGGSDLEGVGSQLSHGARVRSTFRLNRGDKLYSVVGQRGQDSWQVAAPRHMNSGAGGGGATFVYRWVKGQEAPELLVLAGGGGGQDNVTFPLIGDSTADRAEAESPNRSRWASGEQIAEWSRVTEETSFAGRGCPLLLPPLPSPSSTPLPSHNDSRLGVQAAAGGFGAGHGACRQAGGHGGGLDLTAVNATYVTTAGFPGSVFVHNSSLDSSFKFHSHGEDGRVEVQVVNWQCPCDFLCLWHRPELLQRAAVSPIGERAFVCVCPSNKQVAPDGLSCVPSQDSAPAQLSSGSGSAVADPRASRPHDEMPWGTAVIISVSVVLALVILVVGFFLYVMRSHPHMRLWSLRVALTGCARIRSHSLPLTSLPTSTMPARVIHINPNYSLVNSKLNEQKLPSIPRDNLRMSTQLGHGAFGEVYKAFLSGVSGTEREVAVAVKTLPTLCSEQTELDFFMEAFIVSKFHHPNIVQFLGVCFDQHPRYIVLEILEGGNLKSFLRESRATEGGMTKLTVGDLIVLSKDVCRGCCYLEENHFIHRDIAARNCLLTSKGPDRVAKIADFGMSRDVYRADYYKKEGRALLPLKWMPHEAFMEGVFTTKTDVWSFGVVLWEIFTMGYMPYPALSNIEVMNFIYIGGRLDCPEGCPPAVYELMLSSWRHKSEERPTFTFILQLLETIHQDSATMSQHLPPFRLPHQYTGSGNRNLKLLNHPVPDLGLTWSQDPAPPPPSGNNPNLNLNLNPNLNSTTAQQESLPLLCNNVNESSSLFKAGAYSPYRQVVTSQQALPPKRTLSVDIDGCTGGAGGSGDKGSCSSLEPLLSSPLLSCSPPPESLFKSSAAPSPYKKVVTTSQQALLPPVQEDALCGQ